MNDFFSDQLGSPLEWFGLAHILLTLGFIATVILIWIFAPKLKGHKNERWFRYVLVAVVFLFEWPVFESRMLTGSPFRMPLCAVALYGLTYAVLFKKEKVFNVVYFYAFGSLLSFIFYDTLWGLDRWYGWTFFGAHATIAWLAVYGYRALGFTPVKRDLGRAYVFLAIYAAISGYGTLRFGGSDELFLFTPPVAFLNALSDIHPLVYLVPFMAFAALLVFAMYLPIWLTERKRTRIPQSR
jgi:uncharacterized membrane protein YwaF